MHNINKYINYHKGKNILTGPHCRQQSETVLSHAKYLPAAGEERHPSSTKQQATNQVHAVDTVNALLLIT